MDSLQKSLEVNAIFFISPNVDTILRSIDIEYQTLLVEALATKLTYPGDECDDQWAINICNEVFFKVDFSGEDGTISVWDIEIIDDIDEYLDFILLNKYVFIDKH